MTCTKPQPQIDVNDFGGLLLEKGTTLTRPDLDIMF